MRAWWKFRLGLVVAVAMVLAQASSMAGRLTPGPATPAPEIESSVWINGGPTSLSALRGKVVLIEFWTHG